VLAHPPFDPALDAFLENLHRSYKLAVVTSSARDEIVPCWPPAVCGATSTRWSARRM